jgi:polysaccharide export outer membrane protein
MLKWNPAGAGLKVIFAFAAISLITSCVPKKQIVYFAKEDTTGRPLPPFYEPVIEAYDKVKILVNSIDKEATSFFSYSSNDNSSNAPGYLVSTTGYIDIPLIGNFHIGGLTTAQAKDSLKLLLEKYLNRPNVLVTLTTFKVIMLGAISNGIYATDRDKLTIIEAVATAGGIGDNGKKNNVMIIREKGNGREYGYVDLTSKAVLTSPYYYLHNNDIIYVEPTMRSRLNALSSYYALLGVISGMLALVLVYTTNK